MVKMVQTGQLGQTVRHRKGWTNRRYQVHYLSALLGYAVDKNSSLVSEFITTEISGVVIDR